MNSSVIICKTCEYFVSEKRSYEYRKTRVSPITVVYYNYYGCCHPSYVEEINGESLFSCEEMRKKKGWFRKEGECGPSAKLYKEK